MKALSYTAARAKLAAVMDKVCRDHEPVVVTRKDEPAVVLLSLEDYQALEDTAYRVRSPQNARRLLASIRKLGQDNGTAPMPRA